MAIGVTYKAIRFNDHPRTGGSYPKIVTRNYHEKTSREYKRSEISPEQERERESYSESNSDGSDLGTAQAIYGSALGLAKAQHVEQKPCTDSRSESGSASWA